MAVAADENAITRRKAIFKGFGDATKPVVAMLKHQQTHDPRLVNAARPPISWAEDVYVRSPKVGSRRTRRG